MDSISELFDEGLDSLLNAAFSLIFVGTGMLLLDWPLALAVMAGFLPLTWLSAWFQRESAVAYRRTRETIALVIVHFVETFNGIRAVQAFRRERRNDAIFGELNKGYADASLRSMRLVARVLPRGHPDRQPRGRRGAAVRRRPGDRPRDAGRRARHVPALLRQVLRAAAGRVAVLQHLPVGRGGAGEALWRAGRAALGARAAQPSPARPAAGRRRPWTPARAVVDPLRLPGRRRAAAARPRRSRPARRSRWSARPARARRRSPGCWPGSTTRTRARCCSTAWTCASVADSDLRREIILITQENFLFSASIAENIELGKPSATQRRDRGGGPRRSAPAEFILASCRMATTRRWASAAAGCRPASAS